MNTNGGFLVTKVKQLSDRVFEKILNEKKIDAFNGAQGRILYVLWQGDGISIKALSDQCGLAITSLTSMLERMEKQGLLRRESDEKDKRKTLLFLTDRAYALREDYEAVSAQMGAVFYEGFSEEEIRLFESFLRRVLRNNVKRYHMIDDFSKPEFYPGKLRLMEKPRPQNFLLTGMSDLCVWKPEWLEEVLAKMRANPQHQFLFLSKRPDLLNIDCELDNAWFGVTVTRRADLWRIDALRKNVRAKHYHVTFEPLFDDPGEVDLQGIDWLVVGTMTGAQSRKVHTDPAWARSLTEQAHVRNIPVFWKEDLLPIMGEESMVQELPEPFNKVLEEQKAWRK